MMAAASQSPGCAQAIADKAGSVAKAYGVLRDFKLWKLAS